MGRHRIAYPTAFPELDVHIQAESPDDMDLPGLALHELKGDRKGIWAVSVSGNWRATFRFSGRDAGHVNYEDYH